MSSIDACLSGIGLMNERFLSHTEAERREHIRERTVSITVPDLATVFDMRLTLNGLVDITHRPADQHSAQRAPSAQVRITVTSKDMVDIAEERRSARMSLLTRRVKVDASVGDLLHLRRVLF